MRFLRRANHLRRQLGYHSVHGPGDSPRWGPIMSLSEVNAAKAIFGWPLYSTFNAVSFAGAQPGWRARLVTFTQFLPVLCITTGIWSVIWATPIWLLASIVT
jgi:hypothetical protein